MRKYLAYYETEWPANIAELTAVENKPFVGYLKGEGVLFTVIPKPAGPPNDEIWYTTTDGSIVEHNINGPASFDPDFAYNATCNVNVLSNTYENGLGIIRFDGPVERICGNSSGCTAFYAGGGGPNDKLKTVILPEGFKKIGFWAFGGADMGNCINLTSITIPSSVTNFDDGAFACLSIETIIFNGTKAQWDDIEKPDNWKLWTSATAVNCKDGDIKLILDFSYGINMENDYEVWYTTSDGQVAEFTTDSDMGSWNTIISNTYENGKGIIRFANPVEEFKGSINFGSSFWDSEYNVSYKDKITSLILPNCIKTLAYAPFSGLNNVQEIVIPQSVTLFGQISFDNSIPVIKYNGTVNQWHAIEKSEAGWNAFADAPITFICTNGEVVVPPLE